MLRSAAILACLLLALHWPLVSAAPVAAQQGLPLLQTFTAADYGATPQNWAIAQDRRGVIYVGNLKDGVLEYDGASWRHIRLPLDTTVLSLAVGNDDRVYVGTHADFGYLAPDESGTLRYVSLLEHVPEEERDFAEVWRILPTAHGIYFSTSTRLFRLHNGVLQSWAAETTFFPALLMGDRLVIQQRGRSLFELVGDELRPIPGTERFGRLFIPAIVPWGSTPDGKPQWLLAVQRSGFELFDGEKLVPWPTEVDDDLKDALVYGARVLPSGALALATLRGGLVVLNRDGSERQRLTKATGLPDNSIYALELDDQGGLWLAFATGLARLEPESPVVGAGCETGAERTRQCGQPRC